MTKPQPHIVDFVSGKALHVHEDKVQVKEDGETVKTLRSKKEVDRFMKHDLEVEQ